MATIADDPELVTLGIDTHADIHVAATLDRVGRVLGTIVIPTTTEGANQLLEWASMFGVIDRIGVEGTGAYGARLARWLANNGLMMVEVDRADCKARRFHGKSDVQDGRASRRDPMTPRGGYRLSGIGDDRAVSGATPRQAT